MRKVNVCLLVTAATLFGAIGGFGVAELRSSEDAFTARRENYTDRGRICIEAAAMIRNGESDLALKYLEGKTLHAIRGVPMGRKYDELPEKSQVMMVSARRYDNAFTEVDLEIDRISPDVPADHPDLSDPVRALPDSML